jgi:hypothetical protein
MLPAPQRCVTHRHCEERSDEAIQRARSAPNKKRGIGGRLGAFFGAPAGARWIASLRSQ